MKKKVYFLFKPMDYELLMRREREKSESQL